MPAELLESQKSQKKTVAVLKSEVAATRRAIMLRASLMGMCRV